MNIRHIIHFIKKDQDKIINHLIYTLQEINQMIKDLYNFNK